MKDHWNQIYTSIGVERLGWYEKMPGPCLELLEKCQLHRDDPILDVGAGASTFVDCLVERGYRQVIAVDISEAALAKLQERLGEDKASQIRWIVDDVTQPTQFRDLQGIALWHDRALLHFLLEENQREAYQTTLQHVLRPGGFVIIAAFSLDGATRCSGLDVRNYDRDMLAHLLGKDFELLDCFHHVYHMPAGEPRPFVYALFRRAEGNSPR